MPTPNDDNEPLTSTKVLDAFLKETRITLLYGIPLAVISYLLKIISWDSGFLTVLLSLYAFVTILANEDKETLDENIKTILICLAMDIGYYQLSLWLSHKMFEEHNLDEKFRAEGNQFSHQLILLLHEYLTFVDRIGFFRIVVYSVVIAVVCIAKIITKFSV